jgi:hypothetical protein
MQNITEPIFFGGGYLKRLGLQLGFNSQASTLDLEYVIDTERGQLFDSSNIVPGNISGVNVGAVKFYGIIESWTYNNSQNGFTYNTKISDPRILFSDIQLILDGTGPNIPNATNLALGSGIYNLVNVYDYYGNDGDADYNRNGMSWNKIKNVINLNQEFNLFGKIFKFNFDSGFEAPDYLRINQNIASLEEVLNEVANKIGVDFYVDIDESYNPSNLFNIINIKSVSRKTQESTEGVQIDNFIAAQKNAGTLISYQRGQELRRGASSVVVEGDYQSQLYVATQGVQSWGKTGDGLIVCAAGNNYTSLNNYIHPNDKAEFGFVLLDSIVSDDARITNNLPELQFDGRQKYRLGETYPPTNFIGDITSNIKGYRPTENVLRAALTSKNAWEAVLYKEMPNVAEALGIQSWIIHNFTDPEIINAYSTYGNKFDFYSLDSNNLQRTAEQVALLESVYQLTKEAAELHYGKTFLVELPFYAGKVVNTSQDASTLDTRYGYEVIDSVYSDGISFAIFKAANSAFMDNLGRVKAHVVLSNVRDNQGNFSKLIYNIVDANGNVIYYDSTNKTSDTAKVDLGLIPTSDYILDNKDLYIACEVEQDKNNTTRAIVQLKTPIMYKNFIDENYPSAFVEFLRAMGFTEKAIFQGFRKGELLDNTSWNPEGPNALTAQENITPLVNFADFYPELGLAPKRVTSFNFFKIPIIDNFKRYGPYIKQSNRIGGVSIIRDESISPETFNSFSVMNQAGNQIAANALTLTNIMDFGNLVLSGTPILNIGDKLGVNSNITSVNMNVGVDGLTTSYSLQTFALPPYRLSRILNDKIIKYSVELNKVKQDIIDIDKKAKEIIKSKQEKDGYYWIKQNQSNSDNPIWPNSGRQPEKDKLLSEGYER